MIEKRLLRTMEEERKTLFTIVLFKIFSLLLNIWMIFTIAGFIEDLSLHRERIFSLLFVIVVVALGQVLFARIQSRLSYDISKNIKFKLRKRLFEKVYGYGMSYSEQVYPAEVVQLSVEGIEQLDMYFGNFLPQLIYSFLAPILLFFFLAPIHLWTSIVLLLIVPIIPLSILMIQKLAKKVVSQYWGSYVNLSEVFLDNLKGMTILKVFRADGRKNEELNRLAEIFRQDTMKVLAVQLNNITVMDLMSYGGAALGTVASLYVYSRGEISLASCLIFILISAEFFLPLRLLGSFFHIAMNGMAASDQLFDILDQEEKRDGKNELSKGPLEVVCRDLSYSYDGEHHVLDKVNMTFKPGTVTSIVGKSGCGKSTIAKVLMGFNQGQEGDIFYNGKQDLRKESRLDHFTLVDNNPYFFKGSLRYNLQMGNPHCKDEKLWSVLEAVSLKEYFQQEDGLDTEIEDQGGNLSGGQKQRLALARALLKDSRFYIFDEATSNIDGESEDIIMNLIQKIKENKTILLISHRLKNSRSSDYIYYMEDGHVGEEGSFEDLMEEKGHFEKLYAHQSALENWGVGKDE